MHVSIYYTLPFHQVSSQLWDGMARLADASDHPPLLIDPAAWLGSVPSRHVYRQLVTEIDIIDHPLSKILYPSVDTPLHTRTGPCPELDPTRCKTC
jgi:hypothetical protein